MVSRHTLRPISRMIGENPLVDEMIFCFTHSIEWPGCGPTSGRVAAGFLSADEGGADLRVQPDFLVDRLAVVGEAVLVTVLVLGEERPDQPVVQIEILIADRRRRVGEDRDRRYAPPTLLLSHIVSRHLVSRYLAFGRGCFSGGRTWSRDLPRNHSARSRNGQDQLRRAGWR